MFEVTHANAVPTLNKMQNYLEKLNNPHTKVPDMYEVMEDLYTGYGETAAFEAYHLYDRKKVQVGLEFNEQYLTLGASAIVGATVIAALYGVYRVIKKIIDWFKGGNSTTGKLDDFVSEVKSEKIGEKLADATEELVAEAQKAEPAKPKEGDDEKKEVKIQSYKDSLDQFLEKHSGPLMNDHARFWLSFRDPSVEFKRVLMVVNGVGDHILPIVDTVKEKAEAVTSLEEVEALRTELEKPAKLFSGLSDEAAKFVDSPKEFNVFDTIPTKHGDWLNHEFEGPLVMTRSLLLLAHQKYDFADHVQKEALKALEELNKDLEAIGKLNLKDKEETDPEVIQVKAKSVAYTYLKLILIAYTKLSEGAARTVIAAYDVCQSYMHYYMGYLKANKTIDDKLKAKMDEVTKNLNTLRDIKNRTIGKLGH